MLLTQIKRMPKNDQASTFSCWPPNPTALATIWNPMNVKNPEVNAISDPNSSRLASRSRFMSPLNTTHPSNAPMGWAQAPKIPLMKNARDLLFNAMDSGRVMVNPSTKLWMNMDRKIAIPKLGSA
ncbi:hypothetical protein OGAPHI_004503 [Ogataea philodendri]|uniref:Uncharacterized protein n=1 Tax=Ogataea philodendri TaxID=1378263 RepID=A0A9P8P7X2_9ASCO|nr:uncharacterized protein OGAPHI_004503 [Ogataea philodendri]KAH3666314.1 hypothetical protein OGAPHI_004503 [Ogataea philodendri]